ncbi:hypothetical protein [Mesorhizobium sp. NFR06]|uniref:hypothetical protein n=1 Tax=Mesorhizobium sp. NFR06 TaxID=1566290 RepID=UPI001FCF03EC|nr:hypothetical protein [Mesorhizobium sp. NFR06]
MPRPVDIGLLASLAFGSTSFMTLTSLGGSTPLIYTFFAGLLVTAVTAECRFWVELGSTFGSIRLIWILAALIVYAVIGSWLLPRFFAGQTVVFVQAKTRGAVVEASLQPVSANISQTGYLVLGGLTAIALGVLLLHSDRIDQLRRGFFRPCCRRMPSCSIEPRSIDNVALHGVPAGFAVSPGMPVTADVKVGRRTLLKYILGAMLPIGRSNARAVRWRSWIG